MHPVVALIGAPNCGKTTLYNWLTGSKFKAVNYPGSTVEVSLGETAPRIPQRLTVIDTPGTYSLSPKSHDEEITLQVLQKGVKGKKITHVIAVIDGTKIGMQIPLLKQLCGLKLPVCVVVTMSDLLKRQGQSPDLQYLSQTFGCPVLAFDGVLGEGLLQVAQVLENLKSLPILPHASSDEIEKGFLDQKGLNSSTVGFRSNTEKIDRLLLHPVFGIFGFFLIMTALFSSIYWLAAPFMDAVDSSFGWMAQQMVDLFPENLFGKFLGEGLIAGFGAVLVFVPQIFILFFGIGVLEATGYLARAAVLMDRPFSKVGLSGRSFIPIISGFACAVPAMMATRNLSSSRDRWITNFIIPLMTCSARLPVYTLLLGFIFVDGPAWKAGLAMASLYFGAILLSALAAGVLNRILKPAKNPSLLLMELPIYRAPNFRFLLFQSFKKTKSYVTEAGPIILGFALVIWFASQFPNSDLEHSYLGQVGQWIEPIMEPMGVDWRVGIGILSAFAAREVFVSTLAVIFKASGGAEAETQSLLEVMKTAQLPDGTAVFTFSSTVALLVFFMIALQCMSTFAVALRESKSMKFALSQLIGMNVVAYVLAVTVYQVLSRI